jgi:hypothetical protein
MPAFNGEIVVPPAIRLKSYPAGWTVGAEHLPTVDAGTADSGLHDGGRGSDAARTVDAAPSPHTDFSWEPERTTGFIELQVMSSFEPDFDRSYSSVFCRAPLSQGRFDSGWASGLPPFGALSGSLRVVIQSRSPAGVMEVQLASEETIASIP